MASIFLKNDIKCGIFRSFYISLRCYCKEQEKSIYQQNEEEAVSENVRTVYGKPYPQWRTPWVERKGEWKTKFSVFTTKNKNTNSLTVLQKLPDFNFTVMKNWWKEMKEYQEIEGQKCVTQRVEILGPNLAAIHFFTHRGASIRLKNVNKWMSGTPEELKMPNKFVRGFFVEGIDCSKFANGGLRYDGVENLKNLTSLKWLSLENNSHIDVWCLDRLAGLTGNTLEYLNISGCNITTECVFALSRMPHLKVLILKDPGENKELMEGIAFLEETKPDLLVKIQN